jgi:hypothetical protein
MISVKNIVFSKITKRYINRKFYLNGKKINQNDCVFMFNNITKNFHEALIFFHVLKYGGPLQHNANIQTCL